VLLPEAPKKRRYERTGEIVCVANRLRMPHHRTITDRRGRRSLQYLITLSPSPHENLQNPVGADSISARHVNINLYVRETCESPIQYLITLYPSPHECLRIRRGNPSFAEQTVGCPWTCVIKINLHVISVIRMNGRSNAHLQG